MNLQHSQFRSDRQWPLPDRKFAVQMKWHDLLFMHWPLPPETVQSLLPATVNVDTFDGQAWIAVVPFRMNGIRHQGLPWFPFLELNVRTYVTVAGEKPGVWFFSLDAASFVAVQAAKVLFHLPYRHAKMRLQRKRENVSYTSHRRERKQPAAEFVAKYWPTGDPYEAKPGSLEYWLTARYCMYSAAKSGQVFRGEILHEPWQLQAAECEVRSNTMLEPLGIDVSGQTPLLHYSHQIDALGWTNDRVWPS